MQLEIPSYIRTLSPYVPGKPIDETQREFKLKKVVKLASNENPRGSGPKAIAAVKKALAEQNRYPDASAYRLKQALSKHLSVGSGELVIGNGSNEIIDLLIRAFSVPGDRIVTSFGAFVAYAVCAQVHGVENVSIPCGSDLRFNPSDALQAIRNDARVRFVFLANPNNPTGTYVAESELRSFLKSLQAIRGGSVLAVLDSAYTEYVTAKDLPDPMKLYREFQNVVVLRTFSKIHGLAGYRVGYGVMRPELAQVLEKIRMPFNVSALGLVAAEAALSDGAFVKRARKANQLGMKQWEKALKEMSVPYWPSQGNFILIDAKEGFGLPGGEVFQACLRKGVIFRPVANYGLPHALRISIGTDAENRLGIRALRELKAHV